VAQYEQLRRDATELSAYRVPSRGLALFLQRGMKAWMQAWSDCAGPAEPGTRAYDGIDHTPPADLRPQITAVLAGIILCLQQQEAGT
jgi:hypothetical protein